MALPILSHAALWDGFKIKGEITAEKIDVTEEKRVVRERFFVLCTGELSGVKVLVETVKKKQLDVAPAVIVPVPLGENEDTAFTAALLSSGYIVANVDIEGKNSGRDYYTVYPENLDFANYNGDEDSLYSGFNSEKQVPWFIWVKALSFVVKYLSAQPSVTKIGGYSSGETATALWQLSSISSDLACAVICSNAGWQSYRGCDKFSRQEPNFTDEKLAVAADIEAQSYAKHVKCPCLLFSPLGDVKFDVDRAYDTMARISERIYKATFYSFRRKTVSYSALNEITLFYDKFLKDANTEIAGEPKLSVNANGGKVDMEITLTTKDPDSVRFYYTTGNVSARLRHYETAVPEEVKEGLKYRAVISLPKAAKRVTIYASVRYKNGYVVCSNIESFELKDGGDGNVVRSGIIYTSREVSRCIFFPKNESTGSSLVDLNEDNAIKKIAGPMGVLGVYCRNGLITFKTSGTGGVPRRDALLLFDAYAKQDLDLKVSLFSKNGNTTAEYSETVSISGGGTWKNFKLDVRGFKTEEGMPLKSFDELNAIAFESSGEYLVNNLLWV